MLGCLGAVHRRYPAGEFILMAGQPADRVGVLLEGRAQVLREEFSGARTILTALAPGDPIPQVCVHGHTHVPELVSGPDARPATLVLCPGAVFRSRGDFPRSIAKVEVEDGRVLSARIESLTGSTVMGWGQQPS